MGRVRPKESRSLRSVGYRYPLSFVDHQYLDLIRARVEHKSELLLDGGEDRWSRLISTCSRPFQVEGIDPFQLGCVDDWAIQARRQQVSESRHSVASQTETVPEKPPGSVIRRCFHGLLSHRGYPLGIIFVFHWFLRRFQFGASPRHR